MKTNSSCENKDNTIDELDKLRKQNINRLIFGNLNINSIKSKFDQMKLILQGKVDILTITETKLDASFSSNQFLMDGYTKPFRFDTNIYGGGVLLYIREDIPCKELRFHSLPQNIEGIFVEINLRKTKWLLFATQCDSYFFNHVSQCLDTYSSTYDKFVLIGDFNAEVSETSFKDFPNHHNASSIVNEKTCFNPIYHGGGAQSARANFNIS